MNVIVSGSIHDLDKYHGICPQCDGMMQYDFDCRWTIFQCGCGYFILKDNSGNIVKEGYRKIKIKKREN